MMPTYTEHPVWSFPPNWGDGILERLEWKTDVLASEIGHEQRVSRRMTPRKSLEASFLIQKENRQYLDVMLNVYGGSVWLAPIFYGVAQLQADAAAGTKVLTFDTQYRELEVGGYVILRGRDAKTFEVGQIESMTASSLTLISNLDMDWRQGVFVYPAKLAKIDEINFKKKTESFVEGTLRFLIGESNFHASDGLSLVAFQGSPVWNMRPDESEDIDISYRRLLQVFDNGLSMIETYDPTLVGFQAQAYRWAFAGRLKGDYLRRLLYALRGRTTAMWIPTFADDFTLSANIASGDTFIDVKNIGYTANAARLPGRQEIRIELWDGSAYYRSIQGSAETSPEVERLALDSAINANITTDKIRAISYMSLCRLDQDAVEIDHQADSDGLTRCAVTWYGPVQFTANTTLGETWPGPIAAVDCDCSFIINVQERLTILQSYFAGNADDISFYRHGAPTVNGDGQSNMTYTSGVLKIDTSYGAGEQQNNRGAAWLHYFKESMLWPEHPTPVTFELFVTPYSNPNVAYMTIAQLDQLSTPGDHSFLQIQRFGLYADTCRIVYDDPEFNIQGLSQPYKDQRVHLALVNTFTELRVYVGGQMIFSRNRNALYLPHKYGVRLGDQFGYTSGRMHYTIDSFRVRKQEVYTGSSFQPPTQLPPPD